LAGGLKGVDFPLLSLDFIDTGVLTLVEIAIRAYFQNRYCWGTLLEKCEAGLIDSVVSM
jgi:hypothetical protein